MASHPAYTTKGYKAYRKELQQAAAEGRPYFCTTAGPNCKKTATVPHHIVPVLSGGSWSTDNLTPVCVPCNNWEKKRNGRMKNFS